MAVYLMIPKVPYVFEFANGTSFEVRGQIEAAMKSGAVLKANLPEAVPTVALINLGQAQTVIVSDANLYETTKVDGDLLKVIKFQNVRDAF
jgi:hypothetical protein